MAQEATQKEVPEDLQLLASTAVGRPPRAPFRWKICVCGTSHTGKRCPSCYPSIRLQAGNDTRY